MKFRTGLGYDIHRFSDGRKCILGGVEIPHSKGLLGHSDADVVLHALCDGLLGAIGKGDIGEHFPNTDAKYKDISSLILLERTFVLIQEEGYNIGNIDIMIQAEEPNITAYKKEMQRNITRVLGLKDEDVNIKATTQEGLGAIGNKEGIAAYASVLVYNKE